MPITYSDFLNARGRAITKPADREAVGAYGNCYPRVYRKPQPKNCPPKAAKYLEKYTVKQLKDEIRSRGQRGYSHLNKLGLAKMLATLDRHGIKGRGSQTSRVY